MRIGRLLAINQRGLRLTAFTLLEVIVACAIFFMVAFAVLELVTRSLVAAKALQQRDPDPGIVLTWESKTNVFEEGMVSRSFEDIVPGMYPGYRYDAFFTEIGSNGLWKIEAIIYNERKPAKNPMQITGQFYRPQSKPGSATKGQL